MVGCKSDAMCAGANRFNQYQCVNMISITQTLNFPYTYFASIVYSMQVFVHTVCTSKHGIHIRAYNMQVFVCKYFQRSSKKPSRQCSVFNFFKGGGRGVGKTDGCKPNNNLERLNKNAKESVWSTRL